MSYYEEDNQRKTEQAIQFLKLIAIIMIIVYIVYCGMKIYEVSK